MNTSDLWNDRERQLLEALLNQIIPANAERKIPAAGALGVADFISKRIADAPELGCLFADGLAKAAALANADGTVDKAVAQKLEQEAPAFFAAMIRQTYMGYYSRGDIRALLGLSAKPVHPDGYDVPEQDLDEIRALTAPVTERGRCYRAV